MPRSRTAAEIRAIRDRGWKRYVAHYGHHWNPGTCHYGTDCPIPREQNHRDAMLAGLQMRAEPRQESLWTAQEVAER